MVELFCDHLWWASVAAYFSKYCRMHLRWWLSRSRRTHFCPYIAWRYWLFQQLLINNLSIESVNNDTLRGWGSVSFLLKKKFVDCHVLGLAVYMYSILMSNNIYMYNNQWGDSPLTVLNTCRSKLMYIVWMVQIIRSETTFISISTELFCSYSWVEPVTGQVIFNFYTCCAISLFTAQDFSLFFLCSVLCSNWQNVMNFASKHNLHHFFVLLQLYGFHMLKCITRWCSSCDYMFWAIAQKIFVP